MKKPVKPIVPQEKIIKTKQELQFKLGQNLSSILTQNGLDPTTVKMENIYICENSDDYEDDVYIGLTYQEIEINPNYIEELNKYFLDCQNYETECDKYYTHLKELRKAKKNLDVELSKLGATKSMIDKCTPEQKENLKEILLKFRANLSEDV